MVTDAAAEDHGVAVAHRGGADLVRDDDLADARRGDEEPVGGAALHHLGVAGDDRHAGLTGGGGGARAQIAQVGEREPLFDDEGGGQRQRPRHRRRQVVDRAGHRQAADAPNHPGQLDW